MAPSITFVAVGGTVFNRLRKSGLRLLGRRNDIEVFGGSDQTRNVAAAADRATPRCTAPDIEVEELTLPQGRG